MQQQKVLQWTSNLWRCGIHTTLKDRQLQPFSQPPASNLHYFQQEVFNVLSKTLNVKWGAASRVDQMSDLNTNVQNIMFFWKYFANGLLNMHVSSFRKTLHTSLSNFTGNMIGFWCILNFSFCKPIAFFKDILQIISMNRKCGLRCFTKTVSWTCIKLLVDSLEKNICWSKNSFHPTNSWTSSGLRENWNLAPSICSRRFYVPAQTKVFSEHAP